MLEALDGVIYAVVDQGRSAIYLICEPDAEAEPLEPVVRNVLLEEGVDPAAVAIEIVMRPGRGVRRRVRFKSVERIPVGPGMVCIVATLEWQERQYVGQATGAAGPAIELRTAAAATLEAVCALLGSDAGFRLTGIKQTRAFDTELVITSVHRTAPPNQHFVGATIVGNDPLRSASVSVLHALNRMMGNFLATSD
jgi:hypothetical protein